MKKTIIILTASLIGLIGLAIAARGRITPQLPGGDNTGNGSTDTRTDNFPLKVGSKGERVKQLQNYLNSVIKSKSLWNVKTLTVDGSFGNNTLIALKAIENKTQVSEILYNFRNMNQY